MKCVEDANEAGIFDDADDVTRRKVYKCLFLQ